MSFSKFICIQCTRRLSRLAQSSKSSSKPLFRQATPRVSPEYTPLFATHHLYSTASSTRRVGRVALSPNTYARVRFTRGDVPPREFWDSKARAPLVTDLSADDCLQTARRYADAAIKNAPGWREELITTNDQSLNGEGEKTLSAYTLHYIAVMITLSEPGPASHIATHIFDTLIKLNYAPSILTFVRIGLSRKLLDQPQFEPAVQGFERILRRIGDKNSINKDSKIDLAADACTLRALMYAAEDTREGDNQALRWFRRAYEIGGTSPAATDQPQQQKNEASAKASKDSNELAEIFNPNWQWKSSFALGVAAISMKRGELEKATTMYTMASTELDTATGYLEMAKMLEKTGKADTSTEQYVEALEKAAVSGNREAARRLGTREWSRAAEEGLSKWEKRKRQVMAEEWMGVAGTTVPTEA